MKFGSSVLLEIVDIIRDALANGTDCSQKLRDIDVVEDETECGKLRISDSYTRSTDADH